MVHTRSFPRPLGKVALGLILVACLSVILSWRDHAGAIAPTVTPTPVSVLLKAAANLRSGPGTAYPITGAAKVGASLPLVAANAARDWYQLANGAWVYGPLLSTRPIQLPTAVNIPTPLPVRATATPSKSISRPAATPTPAAPAAPAPAAPVRAASACPNGCTDQPNASCSIKGNVNSHSERIYHTTASRSYNVTKVKPEEGDRWFCTVAEAEAAGFRAPRN